MVTSWSLDLSRGVWVCVWVLIEYGLAPRPRNDGVLGQMRHRVASFVLLAAMASPLRLAGAMPQHTMSRMMSSTKNLAFSLLPSSLPSIRPGQRIQHGSVCLEGSFEILSSFKLSNLASGLGVCIKNNPVQVLWAARSLHRNLVAACSQDLCRLMLAKRRLKRKKRKSKLKGKHARPQRRSALCHIFIAYCKNAKVM